jgi:hypothetical protein
VFEDFYTSLVNEYINAVVVDKSQPRRSTLPTATERTEEMTPIMDTNDLRQDKPNKPLPARPPKSASKPLPVVIPQSKSEDGTPQQKPLPTPPPHDKRKALPSPPQEQRKALPPPPSTPSPQECKSYPLYERKESEEQFHDSISECSSPLPLSDNEGRQTDEEANKTWSDTESDDQE